MRRDSNRVGRIWSVVVRRVGCGIQNEKNDDNYRLRRRGNYIYIFPTEILELRQL
jgi:hypothetical protein